MQFGTHNPVEVKDRGTQSPMAVFTRGLQTPGQQWRFQFDNGYGASVINDGYGAEQGLYELGVLKGERLTYETPITDDVIGFLTAEQVTEHLDAIAALTEESMAQFRADRKKRERDEEIERLELRLADLRAGRDGAETYARSSVSRAD